MSWIQNNLNPFLEYSSVQSALIVIAAVIIAKIADMIFTRLFRQIVSKTKIADHIYGVGADIEERVVEIYLSRLRKKLIDHGVVIKVARGLGYMMRVKE